MRSGQLGDCMVVHIQGRGRLRLKREQCHHSVLWLLLRGMTQERINGREWLVEPGNGLLFRPGDAMEGETSEEIEGLSILFSSQWQAPPAVPIPPLLAVGPQARSVLRQARQLAVATAQRPAGAIHAADQLREALQEWFDGWLQPQRRERLSSRRRRATVNEARQWMAERLQERFSVVELSRAVDVSPWQLQYYVLQELGHFASGVTSGGYRLRFGESPRQTRRRSLSVPKGAVP